PSTPSPGPMTATRWCGWTLLAVARCRSSCPRVGTFARPGRSTWKRWPWGCGCRLSARRPPRAGWWSARIRRTGWCPPAEAFRSAPTRRLDGGDVDLAHLHHRVERALGRGTIRVGPGVGERARGDLPRQPPLVLAPAAFAFLPAVADDRIPVAVGFLLVVGRHLERERLAVLERRAAVEAHAGDAHYREVDRQHVALLAIGIVPGGVVDGVDAAVGEGRGIEVRGFQRVAVVPQADRVLGNHGQVLIGQAGCA